MKFKKFEREIFSIAVKFFILFHLTGRRTLAVITKLDLMDAGTDAVDILCGRGKCRDDKILLGVLQVSSYRSHSDLKIN